VQAVGGINEKIEGFFRICKDRGLTGEQGVVIPRSTLDDLSLRRVVLDAVDQGLFHVWAVSHADEAIALFFKDPAALIKDVSSAAQSPREVRRELVDTISDAVSKRLKWLTEIATRYRHGGDRS
jgi:predicted ATP-dependent protease